MNILFIANSWEIGGATKSLLQLVIELKKSGINPIVLTPNKNGTVREFCEKNSIDVKYLKYSKIAFGLTNNKIKNICKRFLLPFNAFFSFIINKMAVKKIAKIIDIASIDFVHTNLMRDEIGLLIAKKYNIKHIVHLREYGKLDFNCVYFRPKVYMYFNNNTDVFIAISKSVKEYFINKGIDENKIDVVYNGVKCNVKTKEYPKTRSSKISIVVVGAISPNKGQIQVIKALNELKNPNVELHLFGIVDKEYQKKLNKQIKELNVENNVYFEGYVDDINEKLQEYDIAITPSVSEAFGRVTVEYMLAKLPVIVSDRGANKELIEDNYNGFIYQYGNIEDLASKIKQLVNSIELRESFAEKGYQYAISNFTSQQNANSIMAIYDTYNKRNNSIPQILVISPIYKIIGRPNVHRDTECVHDLIKYWKDEANIRVIVPYYKGVKKIKDIINKNERSYFYNGYSYNCDGIDVTMIDWQNIYPKQTHKRVSRRVQSIINKKVLKDGFLPDIIITHIPSATQFIKQLDLYSCPKIAVLHYSDVLYYRKKRNKYIDYLKNTFDEVYCRSLPIYREFEKTTLDKLKNDLIYSGAPSETIIETIEKFKTKKVSFLYVGKLIRRKNLDILIKSLKNCIDFDWELEVVGEGPMKEDYIELVNKLNLEDKVFFMGQQKKEQVFQTMKKSDIFCMPSIRETLGLVYIEAMANGCITIGTKEEGIDGIIVDEKNGFLTIPSVNELTVLIRKIVNMDSKKRTRIIKEAIKTAEYYNEADMSKNYFNIVKKVITKDEKN